MNPNKLIWLRHQFNKRFIGTVLPVRWFGPTPPAVSSLSKHEPPLHLHIVSHCWQYSHMLNFQLSALVNHPPTKLTVTYTLYHAAEDTELKKLIARYDQMQIQGITWDWQEVQKQRLFRRAIGRNHTALTSSADWLWFCDCDLILHEHCLDSLADALAGKTVRMVFPKQEYITDLLEADHPMLNQPHDALIDIDTNLFTQNSIEKAKGAFQIVHGDVARTCGYCKNMPLYQQPASHWSKTYEDSMFRLLIESEGEPVDVANLYRIRHKEKGRYSEGTGLSRLRRTIRVATDDAGQSS